MEQESSRRKIFEVYFLVIRAASYLFTWGAGQVELGPSCGDAVRLLASASGTWSGVQLWPVDGHHTGVPGMPHSWEMLKLQCDRLFNLQPKMSVKKHSLTIKLHFLNLKQPGLQSFLAPGSSWLVQQVCAGLHLEITLWTSMFCRVLHNVSPRRVWQSVLVLLAL